MGVIFGLRNFLSSGIGKWTLEIAKNPSITQKKPVEIKFEE